MAVAAGLALAAGVLIPLPQQRFVPAPQSADAHIVRVGGDYAHGWKATTPDIPKERRCDNALKSPAQGRIFCFCRRRLCLGDCCRKSTLLRKNVSHTGCSTIF